MVLRAVASASRALDLAGRRVLVAVSGGVDSTVLAHALWRKAAALRVELGIGHVNHGLRGAASDADEASVHALAHALGVPVRTARVEPARLCKGRPSRLRPTLQEAARRARYEALEKLAAESAFERIATAHTLDDQAETVLLRLLRGAGPDGLGGIPERSPDGRIVRPLLGVTRAEIERYAREERLSWREDASNLNPRTARGRLRTGGLKDLAAALNPRWLRAIGDLAEAQRGDAAWIVSAVEREAQRLVRRESEGWWIARSGWASLPDPLARRVVRGVLRESGAARDVSRAHLLRALAFLRRGRVGTRLELPGGLVLACERDAFRLRTGGVHPPLAC
jgi:tRNA(Ile)-lysidine synthase